MWDGTKGSCCRSLMKTLGVSLLEDSVMKPGKNKSNTCVPSLTKWITVLCFEKNKVPSNKRLIECPEDFFRHFSHTLFFFSHQCLVFCTDFRCIYFSKTQVKTKLIHQMFPKSVEFILTIW